jgi:hypothetical protein
MFQNAAIVGCILQPVRENSQSIRLVAIMHNVGFLGEMVPIMHGELYHKDNYC